MATKPVKHFHSSMAGAPVLNGSAGALIAVLDACLVNGFNLLTLDSLVVADGVLTGTKAGHGFVDDQVILTAGAAQAALNGEWTIVSHTSNTFSALATGVDDVVGSGAITAKAAPAGWDKSFTGASKAAYRSLDPESCGFYLSIDDTNTAYARVAGYEAMSDVNTGINPFPTAAQVAGGAYWRKSYGGTVTARNWLIVADELAFYYIGGTVDSGARNLEFFGDFASNKAGDGYKCICTGYKSAPTSAIGSAIGWSHGKTPEDNKLWIARSYSQLGSATEGSTASMTGWNKDVQATGAATSHLMYPSPVDNGLIVVDNILMEGSAGDATNAIRGRLPGIYFTPQRVPLSHLDPVRDIDGLPGKTALMVDYYCASTANGRCALDITGPWR